MSNDVILIALISSMMHIGAMVLGLLHVDRLNRANESVNAALMRRWESEREAWLTERHQLLDRIQAPTFNELKHAEIKVIKAQQGIKEPEPLEPL